MITVTMTTTTTVTSATTAAPLPTTTSEEFGNYISGNNTTPTHPVGAFPTQQDQQQTPILGIFQTPGLVYNKNTRNESNFETSPVQHQQNHMPTVIMTDSMSNRVPNKNELFKKGILFKKFYGQTARDMSHYVDYVSSEYSPQNLVIIAGTNDISYTHRKGNFNTDAIVENILTIGRIGRAYGATVWISGLFVRENRQLNKLTIEVNKLLKNKCEAEGIYFIDQEAIELKHIDDDKLHLNDEGGLILGKNILNCLKQSTENNPGQHQQQHLQDAQQNDPTMRSSPPGDGDLSNLPWPADPT